MVIIQLLNRSIGRCSERIAGLVPDLKRCTHRLRAALFSLVIPPTISAITMLHVYIYCRGRGGVFFFPKIAIAKGNDFEIILLKNE